MKIWSKSVLVLAAGTLMFSSCLKNIEPEGLADLRGAKAELLRAQTAVQAATAAKLEADAALVMAQAKVQEAIAKQEEAKAAYEAAVARLKELEVEKQTALDKVQIEQAIAEAQQKMAEAEAKAAKAAADAEIALLNSLKILAQTQIDYDNALKDLALAASTLTVAQQNSLANLESAVKTARADVNAKTAALESAAVELAYALALVDDEAAQKTAVRIAEFALVKAQAAVEGAVEAEAVAKAALELDPSVTDWEAKADEYQAEIDKLDAEYWKRYGEIEDAMSAMKDSIAAIDVKAADYTKYTGYKFYNKTGVFSNLSTETKTAIDLEGEYAVAAPKTADGDAIPDVDDFKLSVTKYTYGKEAEVVKEFENALKTLAKVNVATYETLIAYEKARITASQDEPMHKYEVTKYNDAVAAYNAGDVLAYYNKYVFDEDFDLTVAVKEYNEAVKVFEAAVKNYNDNRDKYTYDFTAEEKAADAAKLKAYADAAAKKAKAYQDAEEANKYTYNKDYVWPAAQDAWAKAKADYTTAVTAAEDASEANKATMEAWLQANPNPSTDADKATAAKYTAALEAIKTAAAAKTAAEKAYNDAEKALKAVKDAYDKAIKAADDAYDKAMDAIAAKGYPNFNTEYKTNLLKQITDAMDVVEVKVSAISTAISTYFGTFGTKTAKYSIKTDPVTLVSVDVPEFMVAGAYDGTDYSYTLKAIEVADFVDKEYFKTNVVAKLADKLTELHTGRFNDEYAGYPLVLPTPEEFKEFYDDNKLSEPVISWMYDEAEAADLIAGYEASIEALGQLPDFVKAIEAAQAKFEAFVAEKAAELAADKAEVEAFYARYLPLDEKNNAELDAIDAKYAVIKARYNAMVQVIKDYCKAQNGGTPVELAAFVENLKSQCTDAVAALKAAEEAVYTAEKDLEKAKNGLVSAAELAQRAYDQAATDLAIALAKLEGATIALENAIAVIYGVEPVVPETPVTPPAGDDTTDEGGEGEGGEETPAE